jgi:DnaA family protein
MSSLLALLDALDRYSLETKRPITVPLVRNLLVDRHEASTGMRTSEAGEGD